MNQIGLAGRAESSDELKARDIIQHQPLGNEMLAKLDKGTLSATDLLAVQDYFYKLGYEAASYQVYGLEM